MSLSRMFAVSLFVAVVAAPSIAASQTSQPPAPPPVPKPGPEHEILRMDEGTWDAAVEVSPGPGATPMTSKGVEVNTLGCGGMCLITDFKGEFMPGVPFHGHGVSTWDAPRNKYIGSWTDSISQGLAMSEGAWDPATKRMTGTMEGPDMTGNVVKTRSVVEYPTADSRVFTAYAPGPDGKEMQVMRITYARRK